MSDDTTEARVLQTPTPTRTVEPDTARRIGHVVSILVNVLVLVIANNLLAWDLLPFVTSEFEEVLPLVNLSIAVTVAVDAVSLWRDPPWFRSLGQIVGGLASLAATVRVFQVFPFDFSDYSFPWAAVTKVLLVIVMIGIVAATVVEVVKLVSGPAGDHGEHG